MFHLTSRPSPPSPSPPHPPTKLQVRSAVIDMLDAWSICGAGMDSLVSEVVESMASTKCTAEGRMESVAWLATSAVGQGRCGAEQLPSLLHALAVGSQDKSAEVSRPGWMMRVV